ncbi:hypothetical protein GCM10023074_07970 [Microbispora amethystogenes]|uniref:Uncharacterized protein n=1 Tax=Microbispora amethystogenes TaxID=1427754 RepID=A0ABQ4FE73_9ACTN|nr:hypothetical protein Mam01_32760 [Microbispora amethystogenes]
MAIFEKTQSTCRNTAGRAPSRFGRKGAPLACDRALPNLPRRAPSAADAAPRASAGRAHLTEHLIRLDLRLTVYTGETSEERPKCDLRARENANIRGNPE